MNANGTSRPGPPVSGVSIGEYLIQRLQDFKGQETIIWLTVHGGKPSTPDFDEQAVKGDPRENLKRSIETWKKFADKMSTEK